jgi:hypothetical protein
MGQATSAFSRVYKNSIDTTHNPEVAGVNGYGGSWAERISAAEGLWPGSSGTSDSLSVVCGFVKEKYGTPYARLRRSHPYLRCSIPSQAESISRDMRWLVWIEIDATDDETLTDFGDSLSNQVFNLMLVDRGVNGSGYITSSEKWRESRLSDMPNEWPTHYPVIDPYSPYHEVTTKYYSTQGAAAPSPPFACICNWNVSGGFQYA